MNRPARHVIRGPVSISIMPLLRALLRIRILPENEYRNNILLVRYNQTMKLIIGLGNHDSHYDNISHTAGFTVVDAFAQANNMDWQTKDKFKAAVAEGVVAGEKILLVKPQTYYNASGDAALAVKQFYKIANADIVVVHDE